MDATASRATRPHTFSYVAVRLRPSTSLFRGRASQSCTSGYTPLSAVRHALREPTDVSSKRQQNTTNTIETGAFHDHRNAMDPRKRICIRDDVTNAEVANGAWVGSGEDNNYDSTVQQQYHFFVDLIQSLDGYYVEQLTGERKHQIWRDIIDMLERVPSIATYQDPSTGQSALMVAASKQSCIPVIELLLEKGAVWNALDRQGKCAGNYAVDIGNQEAINVLVEAAVRAELLLGAAARWQKQQQLSTEGDDQTIVTTLHDNQLEYTQPFKPEYLTRPVRYTPDEKALLDEDNDAVMMGWEKPLMSLHASIICQRNFTGGTQYDNNCVSNNEGQNLRPLRILNVGFGMGIIDEEIQSFKPSYHAIIEAHPSVYERMTSHCWHKRADVHFGKWQDVIPKMLEAGVKFDGIFFDTYGEHWLDMEDFHNYVPQLLNKPNGVYSFFNGLAPENVFFHGVACECIKLHFSKMGLDVEFQPCEIEVKDSEWDGIRRKYWHGNIYYLPICSWKK